MIGILKTHKIFINKLIDLLEYLEALGKLGRKVSGWWGRPDGIF